MVIQWIMIGIYPLVLHMAGWEIPYVSMEVSGWENDPFWWIFHWFHSFITGGDQNLLCKPYMVNLSNSFDVSITNNQNPIPMCVIKQLNKVGYTGACTLHIDAGNIIQYQWKWQTCTHCFWWNPDFMLVKTWISCAKIDRIIAKPIFLQLPLEFTRPRPRPSRSRSAMSATEGRFVVKGATTVALVALLKAILKRNHAENLGNSQKNSGDNRI